MGLTVHQAGTIFFSPNRLPGEVQRSLVEDSRENVVHTCRAVRRE